MNTPEYKALEARIVDLEERLELVRQGCLALVAAMNAQNDVVDMLTDEVLGSSGHA